MCVVARADSHAQCVSSVVRKRKALPVGACTAANVRPAPSARCAAWTTLSAAEPSVGVTRGSTQI